MVPTNQISGPSSSSVSPPITSTPATISSLSLTSTSITITTTSTSPSSATMTNTVSDSNSNPNNSNRSIGVDGLGESGYDRSSMSSDSGKNYSLSSSHSYPSVPSMAAPASHSEGTGSGLVKEPIDKPKAPHRKSTDSNKSFISLAGTSKMNDSFTSSTSSILSNCPTPPSALNTSTSSTTLTPPANSSLSPTTTSSSSSPPVINHSINPLILSSSPSSPPPPPQPTVPSTLPLTSLSSSSLPSLSPPSEVNPHRQYSRSHQRRFHRRFPAVDPHEKLIDWYSCALIAEILLQGYLYISENYFAFYSNILGYKTQLLIPICDVISVTKEKTAKIFPNAVGICTEQTKYVFGSLLSRESTFRLMQEVWKSTLIQVVSIPYFSPVIQLDKMIKCEADLLIEKPEIEDLEGEEEEEEDDDEEEEEDDDEEYDCVSTFDDKEERGSKVGNKVTNKRSISMKTTNGNRASMGKLKNCSVTGSRLATLSTLTTSVATDQPQSSLILTNSKSNEVTIKSGPSQSEKKLNLVPPDLTEIDKIILSSATPPAITTTGPTRTDGLGDSKGADGHETDSSDSDFELNRNSSPLIYHDTSTNLFHDEDDDKPSSSEDEDNNNASSISRKYYHSISLTNCGSRLLMATKDWLTNHLQPYQRLIYNQITNTTRLLVLTTTLLVMLFLSALIFLYRVEQVHNELLSLQYSAENSDLNQVQSRQIELRKEIKKLISLLEERTMELSVLKNRIEEILNSYNHLSSSSSSSTCLT